ncbi:ADP-ribosylglycohydrolase family protein [Tersicoccus sp. MR15.9]|uniref:ADP-ribosylglycohydrolase family protein n=1 Tax=Tersicoccus mangrovi TaxID=3121635 RepID=UPI002FE5F431
MRGSVLAGALGDALGYAVEFDRWAAIADRFGEQGLTDLADVDKPVISDDTQMTLFTLEALAEALRWANEGSAADELACLWLAYLRWYRTQGQLLPEAAPEPPPTWLESNPHMRHRRAPGNACLSGLGTGRMGTVERPVNPDSKGCGTVMRSAPFGLVPHVAVEDMVHLAARGSALTHGHPTAAASAGALAGIVARIVRGSTLDDAVAQTVDALSRAGEGAAETHTALRTAVEAAAADRADRSPGAVVPVDPPRLTARFGEGWVAEEALAIAVYCALVDADEDPATHLRRTLVRAANHDGDSDSTAAIAGNIVGALHGTAALDPAWVAALVERDVVEREVDEFLAAVAGAR